VALGVSKTIRPSATGNAQDRQRIKELERNLLRKHLDARTAFLPETKNGESRAVPLSSRAAAVLESLPRTDDPRVFKTTTQAVKLAWKRACKRAGIKDLHFHDLRHEAASRLAEKLPNLIELAAVTGHKDLRMLKRYFHPRASDLAKKLG
jgi:integrase